MFQNKITLEGSQHPVKLACEKVAVVAFLPDFFSKTLFKP